MSWTKLPPLAEPVHSGCLNCGSKPIRMPLRRILAVGFGSVTITRDGGFIWSGDSEEKTLKEFERRAMLDPDHDWRVEFLTPFWSGVWQRHGLARWNLVIKGEGFA